ncbi:Oidioi.mRNA.OKI2018_I69.chr1.g1245.t1.cds [Oikopleura dioica]|uniref:Sulfotransferase n=1 Tax=Oikopleura dioica TaxID=34765 RepID=A0ABN7SSD1_OIKDI|nr:Oidioi.mRNA.OKI2018_I69.chr1.g1245.t1.cds [Oikopleura dioica]
MWKWTHSSGFCNIPVPIGLSKNLRASWNTSVNQPIGYFSSHGFDEITKELERKNNDCKNDVKIGEPGQFNWILILSVQGSGNTWTRQLFQSLTGYYAGGVYHEIQDELDNDDLYEQSPFPGEHFSPESGRVLGIKSHARGHIRKAHAVVLVIRNPYDTIKANFNRIMAEKETGDGQGAHTGTIDPALFKSLKWRRYIQNTAEMWRQYYKDAVHLAVNSKKNFHFLWYDLLKTEKEAQMREVYSFLENEAAPHGKFEVEDIDQRLNCIKNDNLDKFKRKKLNSTLKSTNQTKSR